MGTKIALECERFSTDLTNVRLFTWRMVCDKSGLSKVLKWEIRLANKKQ